MAKTKLDESTLPFATIAELRTALQQREISSKELTKYFLKRVKTYGKSYNAVACTVDKRAHRSADDADFDFKLDRVRGAVLKGIPYGAKDLLAVADYPTTWGAAPFAEQKFDEDAAVISKLDNSGAVLIAKLSMIELAGGGGYSSASASLQGPCKNPWNPSYWAGGSSSGSAAAVAAGLVPFALGSETSGSIMTPASYCGVSGLRPTYGLVSRRGAMALSWTLDKIGVLARSADDCGLVLREIAGGDSDDPSSAQKNFRYAPNYYRAVEDLRIGYAEIDWAEWPDEQLRPAYAMALATVKSLGAKMVETKLPDFPYGLVIGTIIDAEAASIFEPFIRGGTVDQLADQAQIAGLKAALNYLATDYLKAMRIRRQVMNALRGLLLDVDVLVAPTHFSPPDRADQPFDETQPVRPQRKGVGAGLVQASNLAGLPAISIPCGFVDGLPIGLQIVGQKFDENAILAIARAFQARTGFHKQHPPVG
jgi:aspartyl-tRNA(Asn)/glutamyl-tRNA(Gln) amidotransferase subunit A